VTISLPRYTIGQLDREPRWKRVRVIILEGFLRRLNGLNIALIIFGAIYVGIAVVLFTSPTYALVSNPGGKVDLDSFAVPYTSVPYLLLATLLTASAGASTIAGDAADRSITLYLSRPITAIDYLVGKGSALGLVLAVFFLAPGVGACLFAYLVGNVSFALAMHALGAFVAAGLVMMIFFTTLALFLSSITRRPIFAGAAIFGVLVSAEILAGLVASITSKISALYASPLEDLLAVGQSAFGVTPNIDPASALAVVVVISLVAGAIAYVRVQQVEVVG
jgi:ABC-type transport system involved in multi-copper enzyme maturation permease subunit